MTIFQGFVAQQRIEAKIEPRRMVTYRGHSEVTSVAKESYRQRRRRVRSGSTRTRRMSTDLVCTQVDANRHHDPCERREEARSSRVEQSTEGRGVEDCGLILLLRSFGAQDCNGDGDRSSDSVGSGHEVSSLRTSRLDRKPCYARYGEDLPMVRFR